MKTKLSDAEWRLLDPLWDRSPQSAREVLDATKGTGGEADWAYTTVKTMLTRLVEKGVLSEERAGGRALYRPLVSRDDAQRSALRSLVERAFGGEVSPVVQHLLEDERISESDRDALREELRREFGDAS